MIDKFGWRFGRDIGSATIYPANDVEVNARATWVVKYTCGPTAIETGGAVRLDIPCGFSAPQITFPRSPGFTTAECSNSKVKLKLVLGYEYPSKWGLPVYVVIQEGCVREGDSISITYGNQKFPGGAACAQYFTGFADFSVAAKFSALASDELFKDDLYRPQESRDTGFLLIPGYPRLKIVGGRTSQLVVISTTMVSPHEPFDMRVVPHDALGNPSGEDECLDLKIEASKGVSEGSLSFKRTSDYAYVCEGVTIDSAGSRCIKVRDSISGIAGESNPIVCSDELFITETDLLRTGSDPLSNCKQPSSGESHKRLFWGDIHFHSLRSDGLGSPEECYRYARDYSGLDFACLTDHAGDISDPEWREIKETTKRFNAAGRFVTILGYEYSHNSRGEPIYGDKCFYFPSDDVPLYRERPYGSWEYLDLLDIVDDLESLGAMIVPHQHAGHSTSFYDEKLVRLIEVYSIWGASDQPGNPRTIVANTPHLRNSDGTVTSENASGFFAQEALMKGWKLGFTGSSDDHGGHPGYASWLRLRRGCHGGLVGVYADELTRESVWDALWNRRCYATTGARIFLDVRLNGVMMGGEVTLKKGERPVISIDVVGTCRIDDVSIIRGDEEICTHKPQRERASFTWEDGHPLSTGSLYYVRVIQQDGEMAWSSPIWVKTG